MDRRHVALVGLPGSGKSTIGAPLADRLGFDLVDLDAAIATAAQRSIPKIFEAEGEIGFRRRETTSLRDALTAERPSLVACGGGIVTVAENRALLVEHAVTVWLTADLDVLSARLAVSSTRRPLLAGNLDVRLAELAAEREPRYREVAAVVVDVDASTADVVARIVEQLAAHESSLTT